jgi:hypothetical protein
VRKALRHKDAGMTRHYQRVSEEERAASDLFTHSLMDHMTRQGPAAAANTDNEAHQLRTFEPQA